MASLLAPSVFSSCSVLFRWSGESGCCPSSIFVWKRTIQRSACKCHRHCEAGNLESNFTVKVGWTSEFLFLLFRCYSLALYSFLALSGCECIVDSAWPAPFLTQCYHFHYEQHHSGNRYGRGTSFLHFLYFHRLISVFSLHSSILPFFLLIYSTLIGFRFSRLFSCIHIYRDLAFVDRADVKQFIDLPTEAARYTILQSSILELIRANIILQPCEESSIALQTQSQTQSQQFLFPHQLLLLVSPNQLLFLLLHFQLLLLLSFLPLVFRVQLL